MQIRIIYTLLILCPLSSVELVKLSPCARWNTTGVTVAGTGKHGNSIDQLSYPKNIFIHQQTHALYVADSVNKRIQKFSLDHLPTTGVTVASTDSNPAYIYVDDDDNGPTIYVSIKRQDRVEKWVKGASSGKQVGEKCQACSGVSVDQERNVYMVDMERGCVFKWSAKTNIMTVVAGEKGILGSTADRLSYPEGIYLDRSTGSLYVADTRNYRIQKWLKDAKEGITVVGLSVNSQHGNESSWMSPLSVLVDPETNVVYLVDGYGHQILRWLPGASKGETIVGGNGDGDDVNQFHEPIDLAFDNQSNLYVSDLYNHRVQLFALIDNRPCPETSTTTSVVGTMTTRSRAVSPQWDRHSRATMLIATFSIVLWMNTPI